jgi:GNAT superfamily N-acetyltransferase
VSTLGEPALFPLLAGRGYVLQGFENVSGLELPAGPQGGGAGIEIATSGSEELPLWLDVVVSGFETPDAQGVPSHESPPREALEGVMRDMVSARGFVRYLARRGGEPAGGASLRVGEGIALLCGAATLPAQRRHGVQSALLVRRLADAAREGCEVAVVTTQPGSKSQQNVQRQGFGLLYARAVLVRPCP